jgi:hypothetical protein
MAKGGGCWWGALILNKKSKPRMNTFAWGTRVQFPLLLCRKSEENFRIGGMRGKGKQAERRERTRVLETHLYYVTFGREFTTQSNVIHQHHRTTRKLHEDEEKSEFFRKKISLLFLIPSPFVHSPNVFHIHFHFKSLRSLEIFFRFSFSRRVSSRRNVFGKENFPFYKLEGKTFAFHEETHTHETPAFVVRRKKLGSFFPPAEAV